ncbi:MAG: hypothetical protein KA477_00125 [Candidatus Levybacteria bacterium]|nr:hypothetical protein [Candidatus Levybacteria bacterium]
MTKQELSAEFAQMRKEVQEYIEYNESQNNKSLSYKIGKMIFLGFVKVADRLEKKYTNLHKFEDREESKQQAMDGKPINERHAEIKSQWIKSVERAFAKNRQEFNNSLREQLEPSKSRDELVALTIVGLNDKEEKFIEQFVGKKEDIAIVVQAYKRMKEYNKNLPTKSKSKEVEKDLRLGV